jgi:hypothetical protein
MSSPPLAPANGAGNPADRAKGADKVGRQPRTNLFLGAQLALPGHQPREVRVRNLSPSGARIDLADPPPSGTTLLLCRGAAQVAAEVMWTTPTSCGLRFTEVIDVARWMSDRPGPAIASAKREPSLADSLALACKLVERLEDSLASEPTIVAALGTELQGLDLLAQLLLAAEKRAAGSGGSALGSSCQAAMMFLRQPPGGARRS